MLEPSDRRVYWEPLAPPLGFELDMAVATTYSLDLQALIMAAVPMAFGSLEVQEDGLPDQVQALASLQRVARRTTVFCQQAQIAEPGRYSRLFSLLEPVVAEVRAPRGGAFHPKMWLARYTAEGHSDRYRLVVLSRNLTLDRSWDAMFVADGTGGHGNADYREALVEFVMALPDLCVEALDDQRRKKIRRLARELRNVRFERPEGFSQLRHAPIGVKGHTSLPSGWADRRLVISPFLADRTVAGLFEKVGEGILVSREEALDRLDQDTLDGLSHCHIFYWLDDVADEAGDDEIDDAAPGSEPEAGQTLHGLHAKIVVSEEGHLSRVLLGSANATDAAFGNQNVEYCLHLTAQKGKFDIDKIIPTEKDDDERGDAGLINMLAPYGRGPDFEPPSDPPVEQELRDLRDTVVALDLGLVIEPRADDRWDLRIEPAGEAGDVPAHAAVRCRPISRERAVDLRDASGLWQGDAVVFESVSLETLTTFILFEIEICDQTKRLVMNLPIRAGAMPEQRQDRLLANMIRDSDGFLRYLLMLLWDEDAVDLMKMGLSGGMSRADYHGSGVGTLPLLEELVSAFSSAPERLDEIEELMRRLRSTEEGRAIVPDEFWRLWGAFEAARSEIDA